MLSCPCVCLGVAVLRFRLGYAIPCRRLRDGERSLDWAYARAHKEGEEENVTLGLWGAAARLEDQSVSRLVASRELRRSIVRWFGRAIRWSLGRHVGLTRDVQLRRPAA